MPRNVEVAVSVKVDGVLLPDFPLVRRLVVDELQGFDYEKATGGGYVAVPTGEIAEVQALVLRTDQPVTVRLDGQTDAGIVLNAGGLVIVLDADIDAGATTNVTVNNAGTETAAVRGLAAGT